MNYSTLTTDQRIQAILMQNLFQNVHRVREEEATGVDGFPVHFFSPCPPTAHHNDAILHTPKQPLCSALNSKISIQKEGTSLVKVKY